MKGRTLSICQTRSSMPAQCQYICMYMQPTYAHIYRHIFENIVTSVKRSESRGQAAVTTRQQHSVNAFKVNTKQNSSSTKCGLFVVRRNVLNQLQQLKLPFQCNFKVALLFFTLFCFHLSLSKSYCPRFFPHLVKHFYANVLITKVNKDRNEMGEKVTQFISMGISVCDLQGS